ncbi:DUF262 domain-containing HNH endonuclease family protein [Dietzia aurantiaca]|uniref:DUF262 domain-containing HNH endonuclease family protein n=1 Tax=Dietzia aurantiaca TaxID=983873 RepID=A0ABV9PK43_9ACTN
MQNTTSDLIPINSTTKTIQKCFVDCLYAIPNFQRPYSWDIDELNDYWTDVVLAKGDFFFGATVTWESEVKELFRSTFSIIDGQQRLTTSAIILSVIRDAFTAALDQSNTTSPSPSLKPELISAFKVQAENTQKYLIATDDDGAPHPIIEREEPNFKEVIQNPSAIPSGTKWNESARQIGVARQFFELEIQRSTVGKSPEETLEILKSIRGNVLKARVIQVELGSEEDGFLIFETLNTRGADLRLADLVKNLLVRGGARSTEDRTTISNRWQRLIDRIQSTPGSMAAVDQFMWQSWNSRRAAVTEAGLYKKILELVENSPEAHLRYLEELEYDSVTYQYLDDVEINIDKSSLEGKSALTLSEVEDTLQALALFNVSVANSALLAIVRKYGTTNLMKRAEVIETCRLIENFHFQFTALKNSGSTGGTRGRYNRFAVELENAASRTDVRKAIDSFKEKLASSLPTPKDAKLAFTQLFYAPKSRLTNAQKRRSRKQFISYILLRLAQENKVLPPGQDLNSWTIEHIRPQRQAKGEVSDIEYSIGNLTLLTGGANGQLGSGNLEDKRAGLDCYVPWKDSELAQWVGNNEKIEVSADDIRKRSDALAEYAVGSVWSIS